MSRSRLSIAIKELRKVFLDRASAAEGMESAMDPLSNQVDPTAPFVSALVNVMERILQDCLRTIEGSMIEEDIGTQVRTAVLDTSSGCPFTKDILANPSLLNAGGSPGDGAETAKYIGVYFAGTVPGVTGPPKYMGTDTLPMTTGVFTGNPVEIVDVIYPCNERC